MPIRLRSRQQKWRIGSIWASRRIRSAVISGEMRADARGPSGMLIAVTPRSRSVRLLATVEPRS